MRYLTTSSLAALLALVATGAGAQMTKTLTGEMRTETATVEAIETSTREVTLKKSDGTYTVARVGKEIKRFDTLKIGDKITAKYYDNIVLRLKAPGEPDVDTKSASTTQGRGGPGGRERSAPSARSPRRSRPSTRRCRLSRSRARTTGRTARASKTRRRSRR